MLNIYIYIYIYLYLIKNLDEVNQINSITATTKFGGKLHFLHPYSHIRSFYLNTYLSAPYVT